MGVYISMYKCDSTTQSEWVRVSIIMVAVVVEPQVVAIVLFVK